MIDSNNNGHKAITLFSILELIVVIVLFCGVDLYKSDLKKYNELVKSQQEVLDQQQEFIEGIDFSGYKEYLLMKEIEESEKEVGGEN